MPYRDIEKRRAYSREYNKKYDVLHKEERLASGKEYRKRNVHKVRAWAQKGNLKRYGITLEQYEEMLKAQNGVCALCKKPPTYRRLSVDHDHQTGIVRGLLCDGCNWAMGVLETRVHAIDFILYTQRGMVKREPSNKFMEEM